MLYGTICLIHGCDVTSDYRNGNLLPSVLLNQCAGRKFIIIYCANSADDQSTNLRRYMKKNILPNQEFYNREVSSTPNRRNGYYSSNGGRGSTVGEYQHSNQDRINLQRNVLQTALGGGSWGMNNGNMYNNGGYHYY